ncbi:MAG: hypothetical protein M3N31_05980 [Actinomycetota bacterium]|nr:hypothetical protein [Actinomycetota bacterium]
MSRRRIVAGLAAAAGAVTLMAGPAEAEHDHYVVTPNGRCHQVARGQTAIAPGHGGYHRYHHKVHLGATGSTGTLGDGRSRVKVYKESCPG